MTPRPQSTRKPRHSSKPLAAGVTLFILLAIGLARLLGIVPSSSANTASPAQESQATQPSQTRTVGDGQTAPARDARFADERGVLDAIRARRSDVMVDLSVRVKRLLPDDNEGDRHQRFIVELSGGQTILIAHNIDLAPRAPVKPGETVGLRGEYEWNEQGGVIHWTHHDPRDRRPGGWILHAGKKYE